MDSPTYSATLLKMDDPDFLGVGDSETTCELCYAEFLDPEDLSMHIRQVHSNEEKTFLIKCHFCDYGCSDLESYSLHIRDKHLRQLESCKYCSRVFDDPISHKKHERSHLKESQKNKYYCSVCKCAFSTIAELEIHEYENHKDASSENGIFINEVFPILSSLINIKATRFLQCLREDDVLYYCVNCNHSTSDVSKYLEHLKRKNCRSLACNFCYSVYKTKKSLYKHLYAHPECQTGVSIKKQCTECRKVFDIRMLKDHVKVCRAMKCKRCDIIFNTMYDLTRHQAKYHPAVVHLQACKFCNKDFAGQKALEKHVQRAHLNNFHLYKYKCIYCNVIFKHPKNLFGHFFSTHKDLEPYTCKICNKKFKIRKNFTLHIKLDHKSIGFVEFDERYHVFFSAQKSENPFNPTSLVVDESEMRNNDSTPPADPQTDAEEQTDKSQLKVRFDVEQKEDTSNLNLTNVNSDFMSATETEGLQSETDIEKTSALKRKISNRRSKRKHVETIDEIVLSNSSDEDEPLLQVKKRVKRQYNRKLATYSRTRNMKKLAFRKKHSKNNFICEICDKQCFTYQNYNNHIAMHKNNVEAKCVKCDKVCKSKKSLTEHYAKEHSTSQLTETLKSLLEKRKSGNKYTSNNSGYVEISNNEKFKLTIKKVNIPKSDVVATINPAGQKSLSVQKFIESFTPETEGPKNDIQIQTSVMIKKVAGQAKSPKIKMTKCNFDKKDSFNLRKLALPVPFKQTREHHKVTVKIIKPVSRISVGESSENVEDHNENEYNYDSYAQDYHEEVAEENDQIPEVAQEVMLEGTEEPPPKPTFAPHKFVIPNLPPNVKKIHIAHLQPEAPYYKIIKVEGSAVAAKKNDEEVKPKKDIKLPDGTTLVSVNPLAHLLGDMPVEKILESTKNKHYQSKAKDFETAVAKAMLKLKTDVSTPKRRKKNSNV